MNEEKYVTLEISPFHVPFLRDLGIKIIALITFDIIYGPICHIKELSRSSYGKRLKNVESLAEIYAGLARTDYDVVTSLDEKIVVSSYEQKDEEGDKTSVLLFVCVPTADTEKLKKYSRSLNERSRGNPNNFNRALKDLIETETKSAHKIIIEKEGNIIKGLEINDNCVLSGHEFYNFYGFLFVNYSQADIDGRFFPKMVQGKKIDLKALIRFIDTQKNEAGLSAGELITLYYKGLELLVYTHRTEAIMVGAKKSRSQINYNYINQWFFHFFDTYTNTAGITLPNSTLASLIYLDREISGEPMRHIMDEFMDLMINAETNYPEMAVLPITIKQKGWMLLLKDYELFLENLNLFNGNYSIYTISQQISVPLSKIIEFVIFLKSRNLIEVYRKK